MSKLITSALLATVLLTGGFQTVANAQSADETTYDRTDKSDREHVCKELQRNCS